MRIEAATSILVAGITKCPKRKKKWSAPVVPQRAVIIACLNSLTIQILCSSLLLWNFIQFSTGCDPWPKIPIRHFGNQWIVAWHLQNFGIQDEKLRKFCLFCTSKGDLAPVSHILHSALGGVTRDRDQNSSRHRGCVMRDRRIEWNSTVFEYQVWLISWTVG
jgi:hypothetical protein